VKKTSLIVLTLLFAGGLMAGCASPRFRMDALKLGMTPDEVIDQVGKPFTTRAAKVYEDKRAVEVWEYLPRFFSLYPKTYWVYFENGAVVQWGEPGDFTTQTGASVPVQEFNNQSRAVP
jgi:hypothetical protein